MPSHKIRKPALFISHATSDAELANVIKQEIERVFAKGLDVFCTSSPGAISVGVDWLSDIEHKLKVSQAIIVIVTPNSIERPWLWFEIGASWLKGRSGGCRIYPLCAREVSVSTLPEPLGRLQALSMGNPQDIRALFAALVEQFGFGSMSSLSVSRITSKIPKYAQVESVERDPDDPNRALRLSRSTPGVVARTALTKGPRLPDEFFAAELLRRPIRIEKDAENHTIIHIDRGGVTEAVISSEGKRLLCEEFIAPKQKVIRKQDVACHQFLLDSATHGSKTVEVNELPLRWASGGIVSIVTHKGRKWIPLFFRDIRPYGWNISLGSSERYFNDQGQSVEELDGELDNPLRFIVREFLEETLVLDNPPIRGANTSRPFVLPFWYGPQADEQRLQFLAKHLTLRRKHDGLRISPGESQKINAHASPTTMALQIAREDGRSSALTDVIVCLNLLELGIEVVKVISYNLSDDDYLLDGDILESTPKELTRMPVALISVDYLKSAFGGQQDWIYTAGPQPSVRVLAPLSEDNIRIFDWDIRQRLEIVRGEKEGAGTEFKRYSDWYDKFHANFFDQHDQPYTSNPSQLFTPATAKVLSLCFGQIKSEVL